MGIAIIFGGLAGLALGYTVGVQHGRQRQQVKFDRIGSAMDQASLRIRESRLRRDGSIKP